MGKKKYVWIILDGYGDYLGMQKGCIIHRDKEGVEVKYPLSENLINEIVLKKLEYTNEQIIQDTINMIRKYITE